MDIRIRQTGKPIILILIGFLLFTCTGQTATAGSLKLKKNSIEIGYGRFTIGDSRYKDVFKTGREIYSIEYSRSLFTIGRNNLGAIGGIRYFRKTGLATFTLEKTYLTLLPISLGGRYILDLGYFLPWIDLGMDIMIYRESSPIKKTLGFTIGPFVQAGLSVRIPYFEAFKIRASVRHSYVKARREGISVNLGGFEYSIGLAFGF
ncbi:hypothetical protein ACFLT9_03935 [Acidobacteriota bacterium]